jgi:hypothetical protein
MQAATKTTAIHAVQNFTGQHLPSEYPTKRRSDPAQWVPEVGCTYPPLELVTKPNLTTAETAHFLNRRPQTLRAWACLENGPIRPRRIGGLLAWATAEVKILAGVSL